MATRQAWEHKIVGIASKGQVTAEQLAMELDKHAADGWEMAGCHPIPEGLLVYFKRPKSAIIMVAH